MPHALQGRRGPLLDLPPELIGILNGLLQRSSKIEHPPYFPDLQGGETSTIEKKNKRRERGRSYSDNSTIFWRTWFVQESKYASACGCTILSWHAGATSSLIEQAAGLREMRRECSE
jgi:hypothetical protein